MQSYMKISLVATLAVLVMACTTNEKKVLEQKKTKLEKLKKEQSELAAEIKSLETEIAKLDPTVAEDRAKLVMLDTIQPISFTHYIDLQGKVDAENISYITPRGMGGQVRAVYVKKGDRVRKGQLLLKLDDAVVRQNVVAARQGMEATKTQLALARSLYERQKNLWDQNIGTEVQVMQAKTNMEALQANLRTQEENVKAAVEQLNTTNVVSNVDGVADEVNIHVGETFTGSPMQGIKIVNNSRLKVVVDIPENYIARVAKGTPVVVTIPDIGKTYNANITVISQSISAATRGFIAEISIPADKDLKPNLIANVKIQDYNVENAIVAPVNTLQNDEKGKFIMVAANEGKKLIARKRYVDVGELYNNNLEIRNGLKAGDVIVSEGYQSLYDGQALTVAAVKS
ncbi:efflux RND transporter periplasmic adaptor subunit [Aridibaculum aurantiacum]|uniref:efflux RND transporter periplasmic adaptor subunit n=1 Tax=Aridibaculum aurantiacum TaxID=2810307 RepID=UPI001A96696F|nr:efflux RND transporter periplasmic adaptor subunit [Aridibaculum aurantiacum]